MRHTYCRQLHIHISTGYKIYQMVILIRNKNALGDKRESLWSFLKNTFDIFYIFYFSLIV